MIKNIIIVFLAGIICFLLAGIGYEHKEVMTAWIAHLQGVSTALPRTLKARKQDKLGQAPIVIGVLGEQSADKNELLRGVKLAAKLLDNQLQLQKSSGRRRLQIVYLQENPLTHQIHKLCNLEHVVAIIDGSESTSNAYLQSFAEFHHLILLSPLLPLEAEGAFTKKQNFSFSTFPSPQEMGTAIQFFMKQQALSSIAILGPPEHHLGYLLCNIFDRSLPRGQKDQAGIAAREIYPLPLSRAALKGKLRFWKNVISLDSLLLIANVQDCALIIKELNDFQLNPTYVLSPYLTLAQARQLPFKPYQKVWLPSIYNPKNNKTSTQDFKLKYKVTYGKEAGWTAAQGFDVLNLLTAAMQKAGSTEPAQISKAMHKIKFKDSVGILPEISFDVRGRLNHDIDRYLYFIKIN